MISPTDSLAQTARGAPVFMVQFAFYAALALSILKIGELLWPVLRQPGLRVLLTRELIYRVLDDSGENFFLNVTLLAEHSAVLVESATVVLTKIGATTKHFPLTIRM